jgi:hypothetical protein
MGKILLEKGNSSHGAFFCGLSVSKSDADGVECLATITQLHCGGFITGTGMCGVGDSVAL